ncbi:MAG TPA: hypothetical protein VJ754_09700, partial [Anaerolineae bacterium]|nr:hypothetical protein [Anaerolineae bacterium]
VVRRGPPRERYPIFEQSYGPVDFVVPPDCSGQPASVMEEQMQHIADKHTEIWLLRSWPDKCDPANVIPRWLAEQAYPAEEFWLQTNLFSRYLIASRTAVEGAQSGRLGEWISLDAWGIDTDQVAPGQALNLTLTWASAASLTQDYRVFVFLADQAEQEAAHRDAVPVMWLRPTTTWQVGERITDHHALLIPPDARPGSYWLGVGMYSPATGERLPVTGGQGWMGNTALRLAAVAITPP